MNETHRYTIIAVRDLNEKKHICSMCIKNKEGCEIKRYFHKDSKQRSCSSFELKGGRVRESYWSKGPHLFE